MRLSLAPVIIVLAISIMIDVFIYCRMRLNDTSGRWRRGHIVVSVISICAILLCVILPKKSGSDANLRGIMWVLYAYLSVYLPKVVLALAMLVRLVLSSCLHRPLKGISYGGAAVAAAAFVLMWWGALINRFNLDVTETEVEISGLPQSFDGYRIVQISDIHTGTYGNDTTFLSHVVECVNGLQPDLIVFTGDIVNRHSEELISHTKVLSRLRARNGVWSVMGNHDYGDYYKWKTQQEHLDDALKIKKMQAGMGWNMLNNDHTWLHAAGDSIALIGVENIGDPPFRRYGSLTAAYPDLSDDNIKILLTHNPAHWNDSIADNVNLNIALTLSGHTHAMQFELFGLSPAAMRYNTWGGLYNDKSGRKLYVNIGLGEVAMPARIGATPEITVLTLRSIK